MADEALKAAIDQIRDGQWALRVPDDMTRRPGTTLRETVTHHAYDDAWVPDVLAGRTIAAVGDKYDGDFPAREYLKHVTGFRGLRVYDLAKSIGADTTLPDDLVRGLWDEIAPCAEEWRAMGVFGPAVAVPDDAPRQDRLLGLTGRQPR